MDSEIKPMLKSVSAPVSQHMNRGKGFVRPNCSTTFWLQCPVCCRRYFKYDSHMECFNRWCEICQDVLPSAAALKTHAQTYHSKNYCHDCNHTYENLKGHRLHEHPTTTVDTTTTTETTKQPRRAKMTRAATTTKGL